MTTYSLKKTRVGFIFTLVNEIEEKHIGKIIENIVK